MKVGLSFESTKMQLEMNIYFTNKGTQLWKEKESAFSHVRVAKTKQNFEEKDIKACLLGINISVKLFLCLNYLQF